MFTQKRSFCLFLLIAMSASCLEAGWRDWPVLNQFFRSNVAAAAAAPAPQPARKPQQGFISSLLNPFLYAKAWVHEKWVRRTYVPRDLEYANPQTAKALANQSKALLLFPACNVDGVTRSQAYHAQNPPLNIPQHDLDCLQSAFSQYKVALMMEKPWNYGAGIPQNFGPLVQCREHVLLNALCKNQVFFQLEPLNPGVPYPIRAYDFSSPRQIKTSEKGRKYNLCGVVTSRHQGNQLLSATTTDLLLKVMQAYARFSRDFIGRQIKYPVTGYEDGVQQPKAFNAGILFGGGQLQLGPQFILCQLQAARGGQSQGGQAQVATGMQQPSGQIGLNQTPPPVLTQPPLLIRFAQPPASAVAAAAAAASVQPAMLPDAEGIPVAPVGESGDEQEFPSDEAARRDDARNNYLGAPLDADGEEFFGDGDDFAGGDE